MYILGLHYTTLNTEDLNSDLEWTTTVNLMSDAIIRKLPVHVYIAVLHNLFHHFSAL